MRLAALLGTLVLAFPLPADEGTEATVHAGGGLAWIADEALEGEGRMQVDLRAPITAATAVEGMFAARTSIEGADGVTFVVRDVRYDGELALAWALRPDLALLAVGGVWGKEAVDADGSLQAGLLGVGLRARTGGLDLRADLGGVVDARELDADAWGRLRARWARGRFGVDLDLRALHGEDGDSDLTVGPTLDLPAGDLLVRVFAQYLRHRSPLGLGLDGAALGVAFEDRAPGSLDGGRSAPGGDVSGRIGVGFGDARQAGRLQIVAATPRWRDRWRLAADVDGQALAGADPGDLFYRYTVGIERFAGEDRWLAGAWFYHRSNHRLGEPGETVTSWNVAEVGIETDAYRRGIFPDLRPPRWGHLDGLVRGGWLIDSSFGEDRRWHLRAGVRWATPWILTLPWPATPYIEASAEEGDVRVRQAAAGLAFSSGLEIAVTWLEDPQLFGPDPTALLGTATLRF
ncbi:MAG TPA: hypothetical protein VFO11_13950 [Candidatus Polarisedimenticolaceae bacterium]|nr:hypothetical protein [Candidatus Polarisedimenticolaceae bacterium]